MFLVNEPYEVAYMERGWWLLFSQLAPYEILAFDVKEGRLRRRIGGKGDGPGEYDILRFLRVGVGDTVFAYDIGNQRETRLSPDLQLVDSHRIELGGPVDLARLEDGSLVTADIQRRPQTAGLPLHYVRGGARELSFGSSENEWRPEDTHMLWRNVAPDRRGNVWSADMTAYRLELWDQSGNRVRSITREVPWFAPHAHFGIDYDSPLTRPNPGIRDLMMDEDGNLRVAIFRADEQWEDGLGSVRGIYDREMTGPTSYNDYMDTVVEILDPETGELVASATFDPAFYFVDGTEYVWSYREDERGYPVVQLFRLGLSSSSTEWR